MKRINKIISKEHNFTIFMEVLSITDCEKGSKKHTISDSE